MLRARGARLTARLLAWQHPAAAEACCCASDFTHGSSACVPAALLDARLFASRTSGTGLGSSSPLVTGQCSQVLSSSASCTQQLSRITMDARPSTGAQLSDQEYHRLSDLTLADLMQRLEPIIEDCGIEEAEIEYSEGVMTICLGEHGTYVLNKQAPNKQLWLSSPVSGPNRYDCKGGSWVSNRDDSDLHELLEAELSRVLGAIELEAPATVRQGWVGYGADPT